MVVGGEEEATCLIVAEVFEGRVDQFAEPFEIAVAPTRGEQRQQAVNQVCVIVQVAWVVRTTVTPGRRQPTSRPQLVADEVGGALGRVDPGLLAQHLAGPGHPLDRQTVPCGQHLVVGCRADSLLARVEHLCPSRREQRVSVGPLQAESLHHRRPGVVAVEVPATLEVGGFIQPIKGFDDQILVLGQQFPDLFAAPQVVLAFLAFRVGIQGCVVATGVVLHLAHQPVCGVTYRLLEQQIRANRQRIGVQRQQRTVVVEHFFEVRNHPLRIGCIATEAAAQVVENAAAGHSREGGHDHLQAQAIVIASAGPKGPLPQQSGGRHGHGELGRRTESAVLLVILACQRFAGTIE